MFLRHAIIHATIARFEAAGWPLAVVTSINNGADLHTAIDLYLCRVRP